MEVSQYRNSAIIIKNLLGVNMEAEHPKVFVSYSWTTPEHEEFVINLAENFVSSGVDVIMDK